MRLKEFWATAVRRWYLVLFAVLLSAGVTLVAVQKVGPTYQVEGAALVFPPTAKVSRDAQAMTVGNPYLALDGVTLARDIVIRSLTSKSVADQIAEQVPGSTFEATPDVMTNAPIISITVEAHSAADAARTLTVVLDRIPRILTELQAGLDLDPAAVITSQPLVADTDPEVLHKDQIRAGIVALAASMGVFLLLIGLVDGLLTGRRRENRPGGPGPSESADKFEVSGPDQAEPSARSRQAASRGGGRRLGPRAPAAKTATPGPAAVRERTELPTSTGTNEVAVR